MGWDAIDLDDDPEDLGNGFDDDFEWDDDAEWDDDDDAQEFKRLVDQDKVRGVSVHLAGMDAEVVCAEEDEDGFCIRGRLEVERAEIAAATIVLTIFGAVRTSRQFAPASAEKYPRA